VWIIYRTRLCLHWAQTTTSQAWTTRLPDNPTTSLRWRKPLGISSENFEEVLRIPMTSQFNRNRRHLHHRPMVSFVIDLKDVTNLESSGLYVTGFGTSWPPWHFPFKNSCILRHIGLDMWNTLDRKCLVKSLKHNISLPKSIKISREKKQKILMWHFGSPLLEYGPLLFQLKIIYNGRIIKQWVSCTFHPNHFFRVQEYNFCILIGCREKYLRIFTIHK